MAPIDAQSWESFSAPWNVDVKIAFIGQLTFFRSPEAFTSFDLPERLDA